LIAVASIAAGQEIAVPAERPLLVARAIRAEQAAIEHTMKQAARRRIVGR